MEETAREGRKGDLIVSCGKMRSYIPTIETWAVSLGQ
jgi:hypothetical protein